MYDKLNLSEEYGDIAIDTNTGELKSYINFQFLHYNQMRAEIKNSYTILVKKNIDSDPQAFFKKLIKYEKENEYKYSGKPGKKKYKTIYGVKLEVLLPKKIKSNLNIKTFINSFMEQLNPLNYKIPWIAYVVKKGNGSYVNFLISERQFLNHNEYLRYTRNYYAKNGSVLHKKGEFKLSVEGKRIKKHVMFSRKCRLFTLDRPFKWIMNQLFEKFDVAIRKVIKFIKTRWRLKVKKAKQCWHYFNRKAVMEVNHSKKYIEYYCNFALDHQRGYIMDYHLDPRYEAKSFPVPKFKELEKLFYKYQARFEKGSFHDSLKQKRQIDYKGVPLPTLRENINELLLEFKIELNYIVPGICTLRKVM